MPTRPTKTDLENALSAAGAAHHEYEQEFLQGEHDEQWPGFYAAYVLGSLGAFTTPTLLSTWLSEAPSSDAWSVSAAEHVLDRLG